MRRHDCFIDEKLSSSAGVDPSSSSTGVDPDVVQDTGRVPPEGLEKKFETEFERHLRRRNKFKRYAYGAAGAIGGGILGFAASPVAIPGLAVVALVGGAGGYQWANKSGQKALKRHTRKGSKTFEEAESEEVAAEDQPMPTFRRLKYLTKWGHWQLLEYEDAPAEWRWAVIDEVVKAFLPWYLRMCAVREGEPAEVGALFKEAMQFLMPLHVFLQRKIVREAFFSAIKAVTVAIDSHALELAHLSRCQLVFPIVLETCTEMDRLEDKVFEQLVRDTLERRGIFTNECEPRRHRLFQMLEALSNLMTRREVVEALQATLLEENQSDEAFKEAAKNLLNTLGEQPPEPIDTTGNESGNGYSSACQTGEAEFGQMPSLSSFLNSAVPPLVLPPEGAEDESHLDRDDEDEDEDEFFSVSGESDMDEDDVLIGSMPASSSTAGAVCFEKRQADFPIGTGKHTWRSFEEHTFDVRSETYLKNQKKTPSGPALFEAVNVEIVRVGPEGPAWRVAKHRDFFPAYARARGDKRFFVVSNWVFPPYQAILIGALNPEAEWLQNDTPQARLWRRFLEMNEQERKDRFKVIISINEGPWIVKRAAPKKPVIIGRKVKMHAFYEPDDHLEFVMDISTSKAEQLVVSMVMKTLRGLQVSIATLVESREEDELPETLMFCGAVKYMDLSRCGFPEVDAEWQQRPAEMEAPQKETKKK